jgi:hypothetical protein
MNARIDTGWCVFLPPHSRSPDGRFQEEGINLLRDYLIENAERTKEVSMAKVRRIGPLA